jgi:two-component system, OmpR family, sensor histidine kinase VicK
LIINTQKENINVFHGVEDVINAELQFFSSSKKRIDICMNYMRPLLSVILDPTRDVIINARNRGVRLRYLTEITTENISYCKELLSVVSELRHLEGIKANFMISEIEYIAPSVMLDNGRRITAAKIIHSNLDELVKEHEYMFDTLWSNAVLAEQRIKEIEEGAEPIETKVIEDKEKILNHMKYILEKATERSVCSSIGAIQLVYKNLFDEYKKIIDKQRSDEIRGEGVGGRTGEQGKGIRWVTSIDKDSVDLVKAFLNEGIRVRHVKDLPPMNFAVDSKHFYATIEKMHGGKMMESLLASNEPAYVQHFNSIFEGLWNKGMDAKDRIADIEKGIEIANVEIIENPKESINRAYDISISAREELLLAFPTTNAFRRNVRAGMSIEILREEYAKNNVKLRILTPIDNQIMQTIEELRKILPNLDVRYLDEYTENRITIVLADRKESLIVETKDDTKDNLYEAAGLSIYSNSKSIVSSYLAIFESLWKQTEKTYLKN